MISSPAIILQRFSSFSRVLISNPASRNILPVKPAPQSHSFRILQNKCCCTFSSLYQSNSLNVLQERVSQLNVFADQSRGKSSKSSNRRRQEYESDSDSDDDIQQLPGSKVVQIQTESLRCDAILKQGLGISRNKLEVHFYEGRIRVNGEKVPKKSVDVQPGDEIDLIKGISEENPNLIQVSRIEVLRGRPTGDVILLSLRKHKTLLIENYETHPWVETPSEKSDEDEIK